MTGKLKVVPLILFGLASFLLLIGILSSCAFTDKDIYGHYEYEKIIYQNPASSFLMIKEIAPDYVITNDSFTILNTDGTEEQILTDFEKSKLNIEDLFQPGIGMPDISDFKKCYQYVINDEYRLYIMDNEIWLAQSANNTIWNIYKLTKIDGI